MELFKLNNSILMLNNSEILNHTIYTGIEIQQSKNMASRISLNFTKINACAKKRCVMDVSPDFLNIIDSMEHTTYRFHRITELGCIRFDYTSFESNLFCLIMN